MSSNELGKAACMIQTELSLREVCFVVGFLFFQNLLIENKLLKFLSPKIKELLLIYNIRFRSLEFSSETTKHVQSYLEI